MLRGVWSELIHRRARTLALVAGIVVATASFAVLTGTSRTQRLQVQGTVNQNFRGSFDVLVRSKGSRNARERESGSVQANFLSGIFGGISTAQWRRVQRVPGVEVAAPLANLGYVFQTAEIPVDISRALPARERVIVRADVAWRSERGLTRVPDAPSFAYVTENRLGPEPLESEPDPYRQYALTERGRPVCFTSFDLTSQQFEGPFSPRWRSQFGCFSRSSGSGRWWQDRPHRLTPRIVVRWSFPLLLSAIDPESEARLNGLDRAVISGRYLRPGERATLQRHRPEGSGPEYFTRSVPVVAADRVFVDEQAEIALRRLSGEAVARWTKPFSGDSSQTLSPLLYLLRQRPGPVLARTSIPAAAAYRRLLVQMRNPSAQSYLSTDAQSLWRTAPARPTARRLDDASWYQGPGALWPFISPAARDNAFRPVDVVSGDFGGIGPITATPVLRAIGTFDPLHATPDTGAGAAPLTNLQPPRLDARTATAARELGHRPLVANSALGGYLTQPPALLTTLQAARTFGPPNFDDLDPDKSISAIRVRVAGVRGADAVSRERIRLVAERISAATGLDVDITAGASGAPTALDLAAGRFGRPALALEELWIRKGVATRVLSAIDKKSLVLFGLILVVCALFVTNATSAAVRARRSELGVMAAVGWDTRKLFAVILLEVGAIGLAAGVLGGAFSLPLAALAGVGASPERAALAAVAATALALLAGVVPALRAARSRPVNAIQPVVLDSRRAYKPNRLLTLALVNSIRAPGRTVLAALSVAIGVCALTLLAAVTVAFQDTLVGTLLGDAVAIQVRSTDYIAVAATILLATAAVSDVLYLNVRDRAAELATMRAVGWDETALGRLIAAEGLIIGATGGLAGALTGLAAAAVFAGALPPSLIAVAAATTLAGAILATLAALAPAAWLRRTPMLPLLSGE